MIPGLTYTSAFLSDNAQTDLLQAIDSQPWMIDLKRRVQHYGYRYDYRARTIDTSMFLGDLPQWVVPLANRLTGDGVFEKIPDQVIVNEYVPGQGIAAHIDCEPCFGDTIASLTLGSSCIMRFRRGGRVEDIFLKPGSLVTMKDKARYEWKHAIPARKSDVVDGQKILRGRRISVTFRNVVL